jgi:hypothetical protein
MTACVDTIYTMRHDQLTILGGTVYMLCRSKERGEESLNVLRKETGNHNIYLHVTGMCQG